MLLLEQCQQLSLTEDSGLLSKAAFRVERDREPPQLWWCLSFLHEKLVVKGEKRKYFRWVSFFRDSVVQTRLLSGDVHDWLHMNSADLPHNALPHHVAKSSAVLAFLAFVLRDARSQSIIAFCRDWIPTICDRAMSHMRGPCEIELSEDLAPLRVLPGGLVEGLASAISGRHAMVWQTWRSEWMAMIEQGELFSQPDDSGVLLTDLVRFCFEVDRKRRSKDKHIWPRDSQAGMTLRSVLIALVTFLGHRLDSFVLHHFVSEHDCSTSVPSRRRSNGGQVGKRVQMTADTIFELIDKCKDAGLSVREGVKFLQNNERLSIAAGAHPNATDAWMRRHQQIYDSRAVVAFAGAAHINLVADGSRHANKEVLVTVAWSWENNTAAMCPVQVILPLDELAPGEMDLTSLIEQLAQD